MSLTVERINGPAPASEGEKPFASTIPVIDLSKFEPTATRQQFLDDLDKALQVGFFGVVNPGVDVETLKKSYAAFHQFFHSTDAQKRTIYKPNSDGQRGLSPGGETALGSSFTDPKEFVHIGRNKNIWPNFMDLKAPAKDLYKKMQEITAPVLNAISLLLGQPEDYLRTRTHRSETLLRALHYFANPKDGIWAAAHTDICYLTGLMAAEAGLEVELNKKWTPVQVPENALVFNVGDMLEIESNGRYPSCNHRVRCTTADTERESLVFFIHPTNETLLQPLGKEPAKYASGTRLEYLFLRLFSLRLLDKAGDKQVMDGDLIKRIETMVKNDQTAASVRSWYEGYQKTVAALTRAQ